MMSVNGAGTVLLLFGLLLGAGCLADTENSRVSTCTLSPNVHGLALDALWEAAATASGVDDRTAVLDHCWVNLGAGGALETVSLDFSGMEDGSRHHYSANYDPTRASLSVRRGDAPAGLFPGSHPLALLKAISDLPFSEIAFGEEGLAILVVRQSGDLGYTAEYSDLFLLDNGTLVPLEEVGFSTTCPWYTIIVDRRTAPDLVGTGDGTTVSSREVIVPEPAGARSSFVVFTPDELAKAATVVRMKER